MYVNDIDHRSVGGCTLFLVANKHVALCDLELLTEKKKRFHKQNKEKS